MGKKKGNQGRIVHLDVVDGRILNGRWKSRSCSSVPKRRWLDELPLPPQ